MAILLNTMSDYKQKSFELANDAIKLVLTLATGVLAFTFTFLKDVIGDNLIVGKIALYIGWILLLLTIFFCLLTLLAIVGTMEDLDTNSAITVYEKNITRFAGSALILFFGGMISMVIFVWINFSPVKTGSNEKKEITDKRVNDTTVVIVSSTNPQLQLCIKPKSKKICTPTKTQLIKK